MTGGTAPRVDSTLSKGLSILEELTKSKESVGVSALSRRLGLTKSNTFRLLQTLTALGYVRREPTKTYSATLKAWQVGRSVIENMNLRSAAAPMMRYLADQTSETVYLAVQDGLSVIYIDKIESVKPIRSWNPVGGMAPIYCVGTGKSLLAVNYAQLRQAVSGVLVPHTDRTLTDIKDLDRDMEATRLRGYAIDTGEYRANIFSLGCAIMLPDKTTIGALGISVPDVNLGAGDVARFGALVQHAAHSVSKALERL